MRRAYFDVTPELLCELMHLPAGTKIVRIIEPMDPLRPYPDARFVVENGNLAEIPEGGQIPRVYPSYRTLFNQTCDKVEFVSWGQPGDLSTPRSEMLTPTGRRDYAP